MTDQSEYRPQDEPSPLVPGKTKGEVSAAWWDRQAEVAPEPVAPTDLRERVEAIVDGTFADVMRARREDWKVVQLQDELARRVDAIVQLIEGERVEATALIQGLADHAESIVPRDMDNCLFLHSRERCEAMHTPEELIAARAWLGKAP